MISKLVIGLIGEKGSGKQTFVNFLKEILPNLNICQIRFSDILAQTLLLWDIQNSRSNQQKLAEVMNDAFGTQALAHAAKFSSEDNTSDIIIFDGIRKKEEMNMVNKMKNSFVIYITADQDIRYKRLKKRSEKVSEAGLTYKQFLEEEKNKREIEIPLLGKKVDFKIENNESLGEFKNKIVRLSKDIFQAAAAISS